MKIYLFHIQNKSCFVFSGFNPTKNIENIFINFLLPDSFPITFLRVTDQYFQLFLFFNTIFVGYLGRIWPADLYGHMPTSLRRYSIGKIVYYSTVGPVSKRLTRRKPRTDKQKKFFFFLIDIFQITFV